MKFGFMVPRESDFADSDDPYGRIFDYCQRAEELGFDFCTFTHHRFSPDRPYLSAPLVLMSAIAARTTNLQLITTIFVLPLYHPLDVAESVASLDLLSNGRVVFGVGTGYREYEAAAVGVPFNKRVSRMVESIEILQQAWSSGRVSYSGQHFSVDDVTVVPTPAAPPPIWIGALEEKPVERAGRIADGWIAPYLQTIDTLAGRAQVYRQAASAAGRASTICLERDVVIGRDREAARTAWLTRNEPLIEYYRANGAALPDFPSAAADSFEARSIGCAVAGTADDCIAELRRCEQVLGCEYLSLMNIGAGPGAGHAGNFEHELAALEQFGREVIPAFR